MFSCFVYIYLDYHSESGGLSKEQFNSKHLPLNCLPSGLLISNSVTYLIVTIIMIVLKTLLQTHLFSYSATEIVSSCKVVLAFSPSNLNNCRRASAVPMSINGHSVSSSPGNFCAPVINISEHDTRAREITERVIMAEITKNSPGTLPALCTRMLFNVFDVVYHVARPNTVYFTQIALFDNI